MRIGDDNVVLKQSLNGAKAGDTLSLALRPEAISLGKQPGRDASIGGMISEVSFLGSVIRVRVGLGKDAVSLDTFNNPAKPPPECRREDRDQLLVQPICWCSTRERSVRC